MRSPAVVVLGVTVTVLSACGPSVPRADPRSGQPPAVDAAPASSAAAAEQSGQAVPQAASASPSASASAVPSATPTGGGRKPSGGAVAVPAAGQAVDTSRPTRTVGTGTPASCTSAAVVRAVAAGGIITFDCGPDPVTIKMTATAKVRNANGPQVVLDGGGKVTLSGQGQRRILYMNTCDALQGWTTSHCQNQDHPRLTVQNLTFADGDATGQRTDGGGGGAIFVRGGRFKVVNSRFVDNRCDRTGPDLGGAAIRVLDQHDNQPVYVVGSTFVGGSCANGGALSSIGVSWVVLNSTLRDNAAVGEGANPARSGTPGGGSGGAIYCDGNEFSVRIAGTTIEDNDAKEGGGAIFFVSNDRTGTLRIEDSTLRRNPSHGFETYPGIFYLGSGKPTFTRSTLR
ncbi:hypothetical protein JMF97_11850 [Micromonospora fiedleri]|uniref:Polymorphic outer membrane protein repeat-containing protein n=1 Tax=Micromonospora fiedleri TaxID=1157498 RepID=A0ABS1UKI5_9ACTN|nr:MULTISPECIES: hypothetical protein [Micromonospora]MBL6276856.1 hypothetical protein [Micromonospora fiedleri]WSK45401.1 hypothetical protein OG712_04585 [Micromonospora maris]